MCAFWLVSHCYIDEEFSPLFVYPANRLCVWVSLYSTDKGAAYGKKLLKTVLISVRCRTRSLSFKLFKSLLKKKKPGLQWTTVQFIINNEETLHFSSNIGLSHLKLVFMTSPGLKKLGIFKAAEATLPLRTNYYTFPWKLVTRITLQELHFCWIMSEYCREKLHVEHFWVFKG